MKNRKNPPQSNTDIPEDWPVERLREELINARKTIEELQEIRDFSHIFMQIVCNYDLKTPLNFILALSDLILQEIDGPLSEQMRGDLTLIHNKGREILHILNTVLDTLIAERVIAGTEYEVPPEVSDLRQIIEDVKLQKKILK